MNRDSSSPDKVAPARFGRRCFLKILGASGVVLTGLDNAAAPPASPEGDPLGVLVDTTRCAGCHNCEVVCAEAHGLPEPDLSDEALERTRATSDTQLCVVNRWDTERGEVFVKRQCMHCVQPACTSACLTRAMMKTPEGPVVWRENKCMGCRYCMISCPFDVPKFEYDSALPRILKCDLCRERRARGELPACVENCPGEALTFGKRSELIAEARRRILEAPDEYVHQVYGEEEAGGTCWLYLASVPFDQLGFRTDLESRPYPELTRDFLYGVPVVLTLAPAFLLALSNATRRTAPDERAE
jgi:Fe-S-cluster-containing dehydrogenase component